MPNKFPELTNGHQSAYGTVPSQELEPGQVDDYSSVYGTLSSFEPAYLNSQLSFPFPNIGGEARTAGQGCKNCVHRTYCPALYLFQRFTQKQPDNHNGINCEQYSNDMDDQVTAINNYDRAESERRMNHGILAEANRNGLTDPVTADAY